MTRAPSSYVAVHRRLRKERGPARDHACAECGQQAAEWAYSNAAVDELDAGGAYGHSENLDEYRPLCKPCHRAANRVLTERRQEAEAARIDAHAARLLAAAPPLLPEQVERLRSQLLRGGQDAKEATTSEAAAS